ncbi:hypothetical protein EON65_21590 [archaeon]|nr:MAG: hypothetical protein EON65_21590 [archaeon]
MVAPAGESPEKPQSEHKGSHHTTIGTGPVARVQLSASILAGSNDQEEDHSKKSHSSGKARKSIILQRPTALSSSVVQGSARGDNALPHIAEEPSMGNHDDAQEVRKAVAPNTPSTVVNTPARETTLLPAGTLSVPPSPANKENVVDKSSVLSMLDKLNFNENDHGSFLSSKGHHPGQDKRRNSVAAHSPDNIYSTIEKFRKMKVLEKRKERGEGYTLALGSHKHKKKGGWCQSIFGYNRIDAANEENMEANPEDEFRLSTDFDDIFFFEKPELFYGAVEICIMFNCLYLAFWITDFIFLSAKMHVADFWHILDQLAMYEHVFHYFNN